MNRRIEQRPPNRQVGQVLMKQKSRRLLDSVLRKKMVMESMKGYGDELQYNFARRSPAMDHQQLSSAIDGLKAMQQRLLSMNAPPPEGLMIFQTRGTPASGIPRRATSSADRNANYIGTPGSYTSGTSKPPLFMFSSSTAASRAQSRSEQNISHLATASSYSSSQQPPTVTKNSARSAISNALSQSLNFMKFKQDVGPPMRQTGIGSKWNSRNARIVPISVQPKEERKPKMASEKSQEEPKSPKCTSKAFITMSKPSVTTRPVNSSIAHGSNPELELRINQFSPESKSDKLVASHLTNGTGQSHKENFISNDDGGYEETASKFRIKKISIASTPETSVAASRRQGRNYITGVKLYKSPPPKHVSINLNSEQALEDEIEPEYREKQAVSLTNEFPMGDATEKVSKAGASKSDFIKGMTFSAKSGQHKSEKNSFDVRNTPLVNTYEHRQRNKSSSPQVGATRNTVSTTDRRRRHAKEPVKEEITSPKIQEENHEQSIPKFYFPKGKPRPTGEVESALQRISDVCGCFENNVVPAEEMGLISKACNLSLFWKGPLLHAATENSEATEVSEEALENMWKRVASANHDPASRFVALLAKPGKNCLDFEDFLPLLKDIVDSHPGLLFLKDAPEFHTRYMNTVIARIFYVINRSWSGQITASELRKSNFLTVLSLLEEEDDINAITDYFSYEHFYVIYCKFWELDTDHDLVIDKHDLVGYGDGVLSSRLIERVLSGAVTRWDTSDHQLGRMSYVDFVWFILSEEDKKTPTSIEYWFRCMDLDGDGYVSMYEMEYFYEEQSQKLEQLDIEPLPFEDCVCQIFDIVNPKYPGKVSLNDLKKCKMAHVFFDTFFNVAKYLNNEQKDPFVAQNAMNGTIIVLSDWDSFAAEEYEMLVAEEQSMKLTDLSKALMDDDRIDILEDQANASNHTSASLDLIPGTRENEIDTEFSALNFVDARQSESRVSLAQT